MASWRPLPLEPSAAVPPLLVSFSAGSSNYTIQLTDLCSVWSETLERKSICIRAWNENTSIDPSDTPENMATFLRSLASALEHHSPSSGSTLQLSPSKDNGLTLTVTCPLPGFPDLKWPFHVSSSARASIASQLILPLVESQRLRAREHDALTTLLAQKDAVIAKLADKLESTGTSLDQVFTALAARKNITRSAAEGKIKGLAPFDQTRWRAELNRNGDAAAESPSDLLDAVFGTQTLLGAGAPTLDVADGWWTAFSATSSLAVRSRDDNTNSAPETKAATTPPPAADDDDDDEFQVQLTPPRLRVNSSPQAPPPASPTKAEPISPPKPKPAAKLGAIGGGAKKKEVAAAAPPPPPAAADEDTASETASEADPDETASLDATMRSPTPPPKAPTPPKKKTGGLGRIGGTAAAAPAPEPEPEAPLESPPKPQASRRLGQIGGGSGSTEEARGRSATKEEDVAPPARETSEERADKKREELKRTLEKQAAAGPTKKKRRF